MNTLASDRSRIGVDIGGTFTDVVLVDEATGAVTAGKLLTTPKEPAQAVEQGVVTLLRDAGRAPATVAAVGTRPAYFPERGGYVDTPVYDRYQLSAGACFDGPAIIEERESTTAIGPGARLRVDARRTLIAQPAP